MANYGDCSLRLPADWNRASVVNKRLAQQIIGHKEGIADLYLTEAPDTEHQFVWVDPLVRDEVDSNLSDGYRFVIEADGWTKNENLWEWNAEGFCVHRNQRAMFRSKDKWEAAEAEKQRQRFKKSSDSDDREAKAMARRAGIDIDEDYEPAPKRRRR